MQKKASQVQFVSCTKLFIFKRLTIDWAINYYHMIFFYFRIKTISSVSPGFYKNLNVKPKYK